MKKTPQLLLSMPFIRIAAFLTAIFLSQPLYAQPIPAGMTNLAETILSIFTHPLIKIVLAIFLSGSAVAYAFNKDNEKIKRNAIAIAISAAILIMATSIVDMVWSAAN